MPSLLVFIIKRGLSTPRHLTWLVKLFTVLKQSQLKWSQVAHREWKREVETERESEINAVWSAAKRINMRQIFTELFKAVNRCRTKHTTKLSGSPHPFATTPLPQLNMHFIVAAKTARKCQREKARESLKTWEHFCIVYANVGNKFNAF